MHLIGGMRKRFFEVFFIKKVNPWETEKEVSRFTPLQAAGMVPFR
jgi:hypothetical protein